MSYSIKYRKTIETLANPVATEDGVPAAEVVAGERRLNIRLPSALREYYLICGRLEGLNRAHNRLYPPDGWFVDANKLVFMEENQQVVFWGIPEGTVDDPPVLQGVNVTDQPMGWYPEHSSCSEFLVMMLHWQAVCGGMAFTAGADISPVTLAGIRSSWSLVGEMGEMLTFAREGGAACIIGEEEALQVFVGGRTEYDFNLIDAEFERIGVKLQRV
jgi:hypothetical protein